MFLTPDDLTSLTGYKRPSAQMRWLREHGWPFAIGGDGQPKVLRGVLEAKLGTGAPAPAHEPRLRFV